RSPPRICDRSGGNLRPPSVTRRALPGAVGAVRRPGQHGADLDGAAGGARHLANCQSKTRSEKHYHASLTLRAPKQCMTGETRMKTPLWHRWLNSVGSPKQAQTSRGGRRRRVLSLEALEDRVTPSLTPQMVLDINTNNLGSYPSNLVAIGSTTYFAAGNG